MLVAGRHHIVHVLDTSVHLVSPALIPAAVIARPYYLPLAEAPATLHSDPSSVALLSQPRLPSNDKRGKPQETGIAAWWSDLARAMYSSDTGSGQALFNAPRHSCPGER
jgi:hypothetical protein